MVQGKSGIVHQKTGTLRGKAGTDSRNQGTPWFYRRMYCSSCWRPERHVARNQDKASVVIWSILTLGLYFFLQPYRCKCCGQERIRGTGE